MSETPYKSTAAIISHDGVYRYSLCRVWDDEKPGLYVVGLNPSTADATKDDPTIRRCVSFAKREGCGRLVMLNLFALRATDPKAMMRHENPIGPENDDWLGTYADEAREERGIVVAAWGAYGSHLNRAREVRNLLAAAGVLLRCLGRTSTGAPRHPLYLAADAPLIDYAA